MHWNVKSTHLLFVFFFFLGIFLASSHKLLVCHHAVFLYSTFEREDDSSATLAANEGYAPRWSSVKIVKPVQNCSAI